MLRATSLKNIRRVTRDLSSHAPLRYIKHLRWCWVDTNCYQPCFGVDEAKTSVHCCSSKLLLLSVASSLDLTPYLVTDSTPAILGGADLLHVVEEAIKGGVTIVQYRDKHADTAVMITTAQRLHRLTRKYHIPLIIDDRVDVALAVGAEGVHLGQDDMHISDARKFLGEHAIIGISCCNMEEAENAFQHGADYLGIGTMFLTPTKQGRSRNIHCQSLDLDDVPDHEQTPKQ